MLLSKTMDAVSRAPAKPATSSGLPVLGQGPAAPGTKYTLLERIGRGGMADVLKGRMRDRDGAQRLCVVKRIRADKEQSIALAQMLADEARITEALRHPNIVKIYEHGAVDDTYILVMEYLDGHDLADVVDALAVLNRP